MVSRNIETASIYLINKFVDITESQYIDEQDKRAWLNPDKVNIKSGSHIDLSADRHQSEGNNVNNIFTYLLFLGGNLKNTIF